MRDLQYAYSLWGEKIADQGEDADPITVGFSNRGHIGVFDGAGGAGSTLRRLPPDGRRRTEAYLASRLAMDATADYLWEHDDVDPAEMAEHIRQRLTDYHESLAACYLEGTDYARLRSTIHRRLPTTAAIMKWRRQGEQTTTRCYWAGDSRCYLLNQEGLHLLSRDDSTYAEAMNQDAPMTNFISADRPFEIHTSSTTEQGILIAATDGAYGCWPTPMHFEQFLLSTLKASCSPEEWMLKMQSILQERSTDDFSMALAASDGESLTAWSQLLEERLRYLEESAIRPLDSLLDEPIPDLEAIDAIWQRYRTIYQPPQTTDDNA